MLQNQTRHEVERGEAPVSESDPLGRSLHTLGGATPGKRREALDTVRTRQEELADMYRRANSAADFVSHKGSPAPRTPGSTWAPSASGGGGGGGGGKQATPYKVVTYYK